MFKGKYDMDGLTRRQFIERELNTLKALPPQRSMDDLLDALCKEEVSESLAEGELKLIVEYEQKSWTIRELEQELLAPNIDFPKWHEIDAGDYAFTDPCYVLAEADYDDLIDQHHSYCCPYTLPGHPNCLVASTAWGDGGWGCSVTGGSVGVDSGQLGVIPLSLIPKSRGKGRPSQDFKKRPDLGLYIHLPVKAKCNFHGGHYRIKLEGQRKYVLNVDTR